jgi:hypothetical protein
MLASCQSIISSNPEQVQIDDLSLQSAKNQSKALKYAIQLLENGSFDQADQIISQVIRINSSNKLALTLNEQLHKSSQQLFKTSRTTKYKVKRGDSLGSIAKIWLGDSIYFVSLARLNQIDNPAKIEPGLELTLPVISTSPLVRKENQRSQANLKLLQGYIEKQKWLKAIERMNDIYVVEQDKEKLVNKHKIALEELANSRVSIGEKRAMLQQVTKIEKNSIRVYLKENYYHFLNSQHYVVLLKEFNLLFQDKAYYEAADKLIKAKTLPQEFQNNTSEERESELIQLIHKDAILLKKNRKLEQAANSWKKILTLQPSHQLAQKYYQRTTKLLEKLKSLN